MIKIMLPNFVIQKLLCIHMAEFRVTIEAVWSSDGTFEEIGGGGRILGKDSDDSNSEEEME